MYPRWGSKRLKWILRSCLFFLALLFFAVVYLNFEDIKKRAAERNREDIYEQGLTDANADPALPSRAQDWWKLYQRSLVRSIDELDEKTIAENLDRTSTGRHVSPVLVKKHLRKFVREDLHRYLASFLAIIPPREYDVVMTRLLSHKKGEIVVRWRKDTAAWVKEADATKVYVNPALFSSPSKYIVWRSTLSQEFTHLLVEGGSDLSDRARYANEGMAEYLRLCIFSQKGWTSDTGAYMSEVKVTALLAEAIEGEMLHWYLSGHRSNSVFIDNATRALVRKGVPKRTARNLVQDWLDYREEGVQDLQKRLMHELTRADVAVDQHLDDRFHLP